MPRINGLSDEYYQQSINANVDNIRNIPGDIISVAGENYIDWRTWGMTGYTPNISTTIDEVMHEGTLSGLEITFPTVAEKLSIASSDATDTVLGTGARTVLVVGLDVNGEEIFEVVALNGQTPVLTTNDFLRINRSIVLTGGVDETNNGEICFSSENEVWSAGLPTTTLYYDIAATEGFGQVGIYTIPYDKTRSVVGNVAITSNANATKSVTFLVESRRRDTGFGTAWLNPVHIFISSGSQTFNIKGNGIYTPGTDIRFKARAQQTGVSMQIYFPLYDYKEPDPEAKL